MVVNIGNSTFYRRYNVKARRTRELSVELTAMRACFFSPREAKSLHVCAERELCAQRQK